MFTFPQPEPSPTEVAKKVELFAKRDSAVDRNSLRIVHFSSL